MIKISNIDKSNYLKDLLIVAKKDNRLAEQEKKIIRNCAEKLGFTRDLYEDTLKSLLENKYISEEPIIFSDKKIAESFITEGLNLAHSYNSIDGVEIDWLRSVAVVNNLGEKWFEEKRVNFKNATATICNQ